MIEFLMPTLWLLFVSFSFGFALTREKNLMTFGFGVAAIILLSVIFNLVHIPLAWWLFLLIAIGLVGYFWYKKELKFDLNEIKKPDTYLGLVFLMVAINFIVYWVGANAYPYLEDWDPYVHAVGIKWIKMTESYSTFYTLENFQRLYIEPYPPGYDIVLGIIHQLTSSASMTLRFFNSFFVSICLLFAFYAFEELTKDRRAAFFATFFLLVLPSFMSHFIWAQTLAMLFLFLSFYSLEKATKEKRFVYLSGVAISAIALTQPSTAPIFVLLAIIYTLSKILAEGFASAKPIILAGVIGLLLSMVYWVPTFIKYGPELTAGGIGISSTKFTSLTEDTSGGIVYSLSDFIFAPSASKIDQETGIGIVLAVLTVFGFILAGKSIIENNKRTWLLFSIFAFIFCILGTEGNALPFKLFPHRFWVFLSIPVALLAYHGYSYIESRIKHKSVALSLLILGVLLTSADPKFTVQTSIWPPNVFTSSEHITGYLVMQETLPVDTKVFPLCATDFWISGFDMLSEPYLAEYDLFKRQAPNMTSSQVYDFLKERNYSYVIIDATCITEFGNDWANYKVNEYGSSGLYEIVYSNSAFLLFKLV